jgi:hypothetical protein
MRHDQGAAFDVIDGHFRDRTMQEWLDIAPVPDERRIRRLRLDRRDALITVPQRMQISRFQLRDESGTLFALGYRSLRHGTLLATYLTSSAISYPRWSDR